jgi:hypothetical protein
MVEPMDGRHNESIRHGRKDGPCSGSQEWVANGVSVRKSSAAELRVLAQTTHTYYKPVYSSNRLFRRLHKTHQFSRAEHRAAPRVCRRGSTVEALATYAVTEFHPRIIRENDRVGRGFSGGCIGRVPWTSSK